MTIEFSILSVISAAFLLLFCAAGNEIILDGIEADFSLSSTGFTLDLHPTWLVWVSQKTAYACGGNGLVWGNVLVIGEHVRGDVHEEYMIAHERIHLDQFRALGLLTWPAQFVLPLEPPQHITTNWNDATQPGRSMWQPPDWWHPLWSFVSITW